MDTSHVTTPDGIEWYVERFTPVSNAERKGASPVVLIPSGEGDCHNLRPLATRLADAGYHAISFDLPGFSRTNAPLETYEKITPRLVTKQILSLLDKLKVDKATFWGNSSGGGAALAMVALYPERVICAILHEVPIGPSVLPLAQLAAMPDADLVKLLADYFRNKFVEEENDGRAKWDALGEDYHKRLEKNFVVWIRGMASHYVEESEELATTENLQRRPIFWTVGGLSDPQHFARDFEVAEKAGLEVRTDVVNCLHFPYVTVPDRLAQWVVECVQRVEQ